MSVSKNDKIKCQSSDVRFVVITGLSGAGKSLAVQSLEDLGYFCVDNLPPTLIPKFAELCSQSGGSVRRIAVVVDIRGGQFFESTFEALEHLETAGLSYQILFLEAKDDVLVRRFKETRRRHPLAPHGRILEGIAEERRRLEEIRGRAHKIIDTSALAPKKLKEEIINDFGKDSELGQLIVSVISFGFKHGLPLDADLVFDVRFLPNPQYVASLRDLTGVDEDVQKYILKWPLARSMLGRLQSLLDFLLPHYIAEGKSQLVVAIGCTGGQHRSVVMADEIGDWMTAKQYTVITEHRDLHRAKQQQAGEGQS